MTTRHDTHPSEACPCDTCNLEHDTDGCGFEFAVNPHTHTIICLHPHDGGYRLEFLGANAHHDYSEWAKAALAFWLNAEFEPPETAAR